MSHLLHGQVFEGQAMFRRNFGICPAGIGFIVLAASGCPHSHYERSQTPQSHLHFHETAQDPVGRTTLKTPAVLEPDTTGIKPAPNQPETSAPPSPTDSPFANEVPLAQRKPASDNASQQPEVATTPGTADLDAKDLSPALAIQKLKAAGARITQEFEGEHLAVDLALCKAVDEALVWVSRIPHVKQLDLSGTQITNQQLSRLSVLNKLEFLNLSNTDIGDEGLSCLASLPALQYVVLNRTKTTDETFPVLARCPSLKGVSLSDTPVTRAGIESFKRQCPDCTVIVDDRTPSPAPSNPPEKSTHSTSAKTSRETPQANSGALWKPLPLNEPLSSPENDADRSTGDTRSNFIAAAWRSCDSFNEPASGELQLTSSATKHEPSGDSLASRPELEDPTFLAAVAEIYVQRGEWAKAKSVLTHAVNLSPSNLRLRYLLGIALGRTGQLDAAYSEFCQANGEANAHYNLGVILYENALDESCKQFQQALSLDPALSEALIWMNYMESQKKQNRVEPQIIPGPTN